MVSNEVISFWKPKGHKIYTAPLILCDPKSVKSVDKVPCDVVSETYAGESVFLLKNEHHRWFWFKDQDVDEALVFVSYDTHPEAGIDSKHLLP